MEKLRHNHDYLPIYIFDATSNECKHTKQILEEDYAMSEYFDEDLLRLVRKQRRRSLLWFMADLTYV